MRSESCVPWPSYPLLCGGGRFDLAWKRSESAAQTSGAGFLQEVELRLLHRDQVVLHAWLRGPVSQSRCPSIAGATAGAGVPTGAGAAVCADWHWALILDNPKPLSPQEAELLPYLIQEVERAASMNRIAVLRLALPSAGLTPFEPEHWGYAPYAEGQAEQIWWAKPLASPCEAEADSRSARTDWMQPLGQSSRAEPAQLSGQ